MVSAGYVPDRGDLVRLDFDPQAGHEQSGIRPALVISPASYNGTVGLALVCPVTSAVKNYPFEVRIPNGLRCYGVILSDQLKSLDWRARNIRYIDKLPQPALNSVLQKIKALL
jgi:mRNA interferase MazF